MRNLIIKLCIPIILSACATSHESRLIKHKNYAEAFDYSIKYIGLPSAKNIEEVSESIKIKIGQNFQKVFLQNSLILVFGTEHSEEFLLRMLKYKKHALAHGLLSQSGAIELEEKINEVAGEYAALNLNIISSEYIENFPNLSKYKERAFENFYKSAFVDESLSFNELRKIYSHYIGIDQPKAQALINPMRARVQEAISSKDDKAPVNEFIEAYVETKDEILKQRISNFVNSGILSKMELEGINNSYFIEIAKKEIDSRKIELKLVSDSDDPILDELESKLKDVNEWVIINEDAKRHITISRIRFNERETDTGLRTEIVKNVDLGTLLVIPKNASVLIDYTNQKYDLSWSMNVRDSLSKRNKVISGKKQFQKIECTNPRFRNVFGGEGGLSFIPSGAASFCSQTNRMDFSRERTQVVEEISKEIIAFLEMSLPSSQATASYK